MPRYRLLFFRINILDRWEDIEAPDDIGAVQDAAGRTGDYRIEVWRRDRRLAIIRPAA